jgi:AhpD family alkylhydroperoxidase
LVLELAADGGGFTLAEMVPPESFTMTAAGLTDAQNQPTPSGHAPVPLGEARVPLLERTQVAPEAAALYDKLLADRGCVPNMFKALGNVPALALGIAALLKPLMGEGALPAVFKELVATQVAALNDCAYCVSAHRYLALQRGATLEQVACLDGSREDGSSKDGSSQNNAFEAGPFSAKDKAGFRYAALLHLSGHAIDEAAYAAVSAHFNPAELIELTAVAAAFEFFPRINSALRIPVTPLPETT